MKKHLKISAVAAAVLGTGGVLLMLLSAHAATSNQFPLPAKSSSLPAAQVLAPATAPVSAPQPSPVAVAKPVVPPAANTVSELDQRRQFALGMIETGNDDREIGGAGEVSRYQIMPVVWHQFSDSQSYHNPATSQAVARQLWSTLYSRFKQQAHREPTDFDMYVLWNTRYGYYASKGFNPKRLAAAVRERAQRFVNLIESAGS